jgi:hypothetical protein
MQTAETIRSNVDAIRQALLTEEIPSSAKSDLMSFLKSQGLSGTEDQPLLQDMDKHDQVSMHLCPWHTCANTKHG